MMYVYYPSCNFRRLFPETAERIAAWLSALPDVRIAGCCRVPASVPASGETMITVCMSCMRMLTERFPDRPHLNLFEFILALPDFPWPDLSGKRFVLQDCFRARGCRGIQDAVRECLLRTGAEFTEMPDNRDAESYDGNFLLHPAFPANIALAPAYYRDYLTPYLTPMPKEAWPDCLRAHAALYGGLPAVGYCNSCVTGAREGGAEAFHLAELLFS